MTKVEFGKILKRSRLIKDKTQGECAINCNISIEAYRKWECGFSLPRANNLDKICAFLDIPSEIKEEVSKL